jgi:hypothetical protein
MRVLVSCPTCFAKARFCFPVSIPSGRYLNVYVQG